MTSVGRQNPRVLPYPSHNQCPVETGFQTVAVVSMGSADHRFNLAEILSQNYGVREETTDEVGTQDKVIEELGKGFVDTQDADMPFEELLALYGYEASDPISEQDSESSDVPAILPDMTLDKEQIAKDLLSGEEEEETQSSADELTPSVTSHAASDLFASTTGSNYLVDEDKDTSSAASTASSDDSLPSNEYKKEIMVGPQYQVALPPLHLDPLGEQGEILADTHLEICARSETEDQLLWDPNILPEQEVEEFLYRAGKRKWDEVCNESPPEGELVKDNEQALYELVKCNFNTEEALRRLRFNVKVIQDELCAWSGEERRNFEHGFRVHGKNFHLIQANKVRTRSVGECVEFYYMWKKSDRYDYFTQQTRFGRKKCSIHSGVMEYIENDLDSGDMESVSRPQSTPPLAAASDCLDSHFNQDHLSMDNVDPCSMGSTACSLGSLSGSGHGYECSTPSETNCSFDPVEEPSGVPSLCGRSLLNSSDAGFYQLPAGPDPTDPQDILPSVGGHITLDFALPGGINEGRPLMANHVDLGQDSTEDSSTQVSLSVTDFGLIGLRDLNSFLTTHPSCPSPLVHSESLS
ncbi:mesoderm induction early response protein 2 isoform X2 [Ambystoma mexicanum]|uniref:mesoderm induction early response protein 2 isoform X2 n=1 Tax=Ambystoma mexicanum TaxID=8296 RepID=UPI0037E898FE